MSDIYIIEVGSQAAGIVVRDREGYRFFAASHRFNPIEGQVFRNAREAERAALRIVNGGLTLVAYAAIVRSRASFQKDRTARP